MRLVWATCGKSPDLARLLVGRQALSLITAKVCCVQPFGVQLVHLLIIDRKSEEAY